MVNGKLNPCYMCKDRCATSEYTRHMFCVKYNAWAIARMQNSKKVQLECSQKQYRYDNRYKNWKR